MHLPLRRAVQTLALAAGLGIALTAGAGCGSAKAGHPIVAGPASRLPDSARSHVAIVVIENAEYPEVIGSPSAPYINSLADRYGLATRSYAVTHPSLPNYIALTSGSTHGIGSDCTTCSVAATNVVDQLEAAGLSWKAYMEDLPHPCFLGASAGGYAKKHDPFAYYRNIVSDRMRCRRIVPFSALTADLRAGTLPVYSFITPNLCDDAHDCSLQQADRFLAQTVPALLRELGPRGFLVLTWDEGTLDTGCCGLTGGGGRIVTIVAGPGVRRGARMARPLDHYGVLATIERALGLPALGAAADPRSGSLDPLFAAAPVLRATNTGGAGPGRGTGARQN